MEAPFGRFEGAPNAELWQAIAAHHGHADFAALRADPDLEVLDALAAVPRLSARSGLRAEVPAELRSRVVAGLEAVAHRSEEAGGNVLVVSSGLAIMLALIEFGADPGDVDGGIGNAALAVLEYMAGAWTVVRVNDGMHVGVNGDCVRIGILVGGHPRGEAASEGGSTR